MSSIPLTSASMMLSRQDSMLCCGRHVFMYTITDFSKFASELGFVFEFIQKSDDKKQLRDIIESKEAYHHIDVTTVDLINTYTAANIPTEETEGETIDMCKAIQEMMEDSRQEERNAINTEITTLILWEEKCSTHSLFLPRCKEKAGNIPALDGPGSFDQPQLTLLLTLSKIYRKYQHLSILTATVGSVKLYSENAEKNIPACGKIADFSILLHLCLKRKPCFASP